VLCVCVIVAQYFAYLPNTSRVVFARPNGELRITGSLVSGEQQRIENLTTSELSFSYDFKRKSDNKLEYIVPNRSDSTICLVGGRCIWIVDIPRGLGRSSRALRVLEHFLETREHIEILRVQWHPLSPSHLAILTSDNTLRYGAPWPNTDRHLGPDGGVHPDFW
jgi:hypothetical protein